MAENKSAPDPFWPAEKVQAVADKLYRDMAPLMKTEGELLLAPVSYTHLTLPTICSV